MKIKNALYDNLLSLLETIVGADADAFELTLVDLEKANFTSIITAIIDEIPLIDDALANGTIYDNADLLLQSINNLKIDFPLYLIPRSNEVLIYLTLYKDLIKDWTAIPSYQLRSSMFNLIEIEIENLSHDHYCYHDVDELKNSIFLLSLDRIISLTSYLTSNNTSEVLILYLLSKLSVSIPVNQNILLLVKRQRRYNAKEILAYLKFQIIMDGKHTHHPYEISRIPSNHNRHRIKLGNQYHQFSDTLMILSEYNYQKDLLDKYLRIYHVLENNMYRSQIVKVELEASSGIFSIREFQRLYKGLSKNEEDVLNLLFKEAFDLNYELDPEVKFKRYIQTSLTAIRILLTDVVLDNILTKFGIKTRIASVNYGNLLSFYTNIVYKFRNAMVHNRETEFHLMHETLSDHIKLFIEQFLIPTMEDMVILLTAETNQIIWYANSKISVYQE